MLACGGFITQVSKIWIRIWQICPEICCICPTKFDEILLKSDELDYVMNPSLHPECGGGRSPAVLLVAHQQVFDLSPLKDEGQLVVVEEVNHRMLKITPRAEVERKGWVPLRRQYTGVTICGLQ